MLYNYQDFTAIPGAPEPLACSIGEGDAPRTHMGWVGMGRDVLDILAWGNAFFCGD